MFCGKGQKGVSACNGDSGGGMFFEVGGKWFVRGLVSFTPLRGNATLCDPLKYTAYTDVAKHLEWIKQYIDQRVLSFESDVLDIDYEEKLRLFNFQTCGVKSYSAECMKQYAQENIVLNLENKRLCAEIASKQDEQNCNALISGSPLQELKMFGGKEQYFLRGFELLGQACHARAPPIYNNIEAYIDWILYNMSITNDIALLKLSSHITMTKYVQPVCLWTMDSKLDTIVGRNGTIVGFGLNEQDVVSEQLKQALIGVVDPLTCIASDRSVFGTHLTSDMFCGKGQTGVSACNGDSGGGMFFEVGGKWFVRGLVSFTPLRGNTGLCDPLKHTAYTDVAKYLEWISQYIDQRVLSFDNDVLDIDYEEKLRLFNFGQYNPDDPTNCYTGTCEITHQLVEIKNVILPPPDHPRQVFALIELLEPANLKIPYIRPICLPFMDQLYQHKPMEVVISSNISFTIENKKLKMIDYLNCQQRLLLGNHFVTFDGDFPCAIEAEKLRQTPLSSNLGSPVQMPIRKHSIINDIALIKLSSNITMTKYVQPVCLWTMDSKLDTI
uniref:Peptidase S1 domain-containing protein n=1 Tax=Anopheles melas TaxID=34690 RepID=A0A182UBY2_9DIPT